MNLRFCHAVICASAVLLQSAPTQAAEDVSASFDAANKLYEQGKFSEAVSAYRNMLQSGAVSPALYFNLGNAFYKTGEIGRAVGAYSHAARITPRDPELRANLRFVRNQVQNPSLSQSRWQRWLGRLTLNEWTVITAAVLWIWLLLAAIAQFRPALKQPLRSLLWLGGVATTLCGACLGLAVFEASQSRAVVISHEAVVHSGPLDESPRAFILHDGAELNVLDQKDAWLQVSAGNRQVGWLKRDEISLISQPM